MTYREECRDLFTVGAEYYLVQCISADFAMGKGIAVEFNKRYNMKQNLKVKYPYYLESWQIGYGDCILEGKVLNLVTKERYYQKPTYGTITKAINKMAIICREKGIKAIAMPLIGCGLDKLEWSRVSEIIKGAFKEMEIDIVVCYR